MSVERIAFEKYAFLHNDYLYIVSVEDGIVNLTVNVIYKDEIVINDVLLYTVTPLHYIKYNGNNIAYKEFDRYVVQGESAFKTAVKIFEHLNFKDNKEDE